MNELKTNIDETEINIKKVSTACTSEKIEDVLLEYVGRRTAKGIIDAVTDIVGDDNIVVAEVNETMYKLILINGVPSFKEYNIKKDVVNALMENGFTEADAIECAEALFDTETTKNATISKPDWIPAGFEYFTGDLETGYVVKDKKGNEFTYCPATDEYISRYEISKGDDGAPMSVPGKDAWVNITRKQAKELAKSFAADGTSDLIENSEWDKLCGFLATKIDRVLVFNDSTSIGAYYSNGGEVRTGENSSFMIYNIDCLAGNHWCITNDFDKDGYVVICGGSCFVNGYVRPMASTCSMSPDCRSNDVGFRIVLKK